jgi:hypothetical protein
MRWHALLCLAASMTAGACQAGPAAIPSPSALAVTEGPPTASVSIATRPPSPEPQMTTAPAGTASTFLSTIYGYTLALPADWAIVKPATSAWDATDAPSHDGPTTDLFASSAGTLAWAYAAKTGKSLDALTSAQLDADAAAHPCPATPETNEAFSIGGEAARLTVKHCPATGGILVAMAAVIHDGTGYVFYLQHPPTAPLRDDDVAVFKSLLGGVALP